MNNHKSGEDYVRSIITYTEHRISNSLISGELFGGLAALFRRGYNEGKNVKVDVVVHNFSTSKRKANSADLAQCLKVSELAKLQVLSEHREYENKVFRDEATMVFIRGHQPPECLTCLGAKYNINPLFFLRHLEYRWSSRPFKLFESPSLPSAAFNIIQLQIITIGERDDNLGLSGNFQIQDLRAKGEIGMKDYLKDLEREHRLQAGSSIVREFNVHSARYFTLLQNITVTIQAKGDRWLGLCYS